MSDIEADRDDNHDEGIANLHNLDHKDGSVLPELAGGERAGTIGKDDLLDEPEEGEISDDDKHPLEDFDNKDTVSGTLDSEAPSSELLGSMPKAGASLNVVPMGRLSADGGQQGGWSWQSDSGTVPEQFYQAAWAKGIQGRPKDSSGDYSTQDAKTGDTEGWSGNRNLEYLMNKNGGWMVGEGVSEFGSFYKSNDGYLIWHDSGRSPLSKGRKIWTAVKGSSEKNIALRSTAEKVEKKLTKYVTREESPLSSSGESFQQSGARNSKGHRRWNCRGTDLEEGEIEGGRPLSLTDESKSDPSAKDRSSSKSCEKISLGCRHSDIPRDAYKDRLLYDAAELLRNVSLRDAQKSFTAVCKQLYEALKLLCDYFKRPGAYTHHKKHLSLIQQAFSGIRAVYAARITVREDEKPDSDELPRLLQLARFNCERLFTSKQIEELDSMMQTVGLFSRTIRNPFKAASLFIEGGDSKDRKQREASECTFVRTIFDKKSTINTVQRSEASNLEDESSHSEAARLELPQQMLAESNGISDVAIITNTGFGGWFSFIPEQADGQAQQNSIGDADLRTSLDSKIPHGERPSAVVPVINVEEDRTAVEETFNGRIWPRRHVDPLTAATSYHERFAGKSHMVHMRLPSPTPSDEDEDVQAVESLGPPPDMGDCRSSHDTSQAANVFAMTFHASLPSMQQEVVSKDVQMSIPELSFFPGGLSVESHSGDAEVIHRRPRKNRDPRKRLISKQVDLNSQLVDGDGFESVQKIQASTGMSSQNQSHATTFRLNNDTQVNIDVGKGLMHVDPTLCLLADAITGEQQIESSDELSASKRQKISPVISDGDAEVLNTYVSGISRDLQKHGPSGYTAPHQTSSVRTAIVLRTKGSELSKQKIKPRDPRRVLLGGTSAEKAAILGTPVEGLTSTDVGITLAQKNLGSASSNLEKAENEGFDSQVAIQEMGSSMNTEAGYPSLLQEDYGTSMDRSRDNGEHVASKIISDGIIPVCANDGASSMMDLNVSASAQQQQEGFNHWDNLEHLLEGLDEKQKQAVRQERARRLKEQSRMFDARKLCLVLDLDHTLLNSAKFTEIEEEWELRLRLNEQTERSKPSKDGHGKWELYCFPHMGMWTKLRPGIWNFLARASQLYELHVYTMGNKAYASEMAKLLDPTGALFAGRVISKGDDADGVDGDDKPLKSKDLDGVLGMESAVVIIDDSVRVWPHHRHNLIVVERYMYFPSSRKQFGLPGPSLLEMGHDEREQDGMLASALMVIERIHSSFFSNPRLHEVDVRDILKSEQRRVLSGCKIVFSRVFPQGFLQPQLHPLWQLAEQFGAGCTMAPDDEVTHVVAISLGTDKVNWAINTGKFVVRPGWIEASAILYRRANEWEFPVPP